MHSAQLPFTFPCGHGVHTAHWYLSLPCGHSRLFHSSPAPLARDGVFVLCASGRRFVSRRLFVISIISLDRSRDVEKRAFVGSESGTANARKRRAGTRFTFANV